MKRLWILNHHSGLDGDRHFELGKEMSKIGVEVTVFMSAFDHQKEEYLYDKPVTIRKIKNKEINFKMEGTSFSKDYYFNKYIELYTALTDKNEEK